MLCRQFIACVLATVFSSVGLAADGIRWRTLNEPGSGGWITSLSVSPYDSNRVLMGGDMLGIGLSTDRGESWTPGMGLPSYEIGDFTWHPVDKNVVWAGTMSGPLQSLDGGANWKVKREGFPQWQGGTYAAPVEKILFDPHNVNRLISAGGSSRGWEAPKGARWGLVFESVDGGETWKQISQVENASGDGVNIKGMTFAANSSDVLYAAAAGVGVVLSSDGGKTWEVRTEGLPSTAVERVIAHPTESQTFWVSLGSGPKKDGKAIPGGIFRTDDAGKTWKPLNEGLPQKRGDSGSFSSNFKGFSVSSKDPNYMVTADGSWDRAALYVSSDGGANWRISASRQNLGHGDVGTDAFVPETAYMSGIGPSVCTVDPQDPKTYFTAGSEFGLRSFDGGKTWDDFTARRVGSGEPKAWIGRGYSGLCSVEFRFHPTDPNRAFFLAMDAGRLWQTRDGMKSWTFCGDSWPWGGGNDIAIAGSTLYATFGQHGNAQGIAVSTDDGNTFKLMSGPERGLPKRDTRGEPRSVFARPEKPNEALATVGGKLLRTVDSGATWTALPTGDQVTWIVGDPTDANRVYLSGSRGVYQLNDDFSLKSIGGPVNIDRSRIRVDSKGRLLACAWFGKTAGLWRYADGQWTRLLNEGATYDVAVDPTDATRLAIATNDDPFHDNIRSTGVWVSADDGASWSKANDGLGMLRGQCITINPHNPEQLVFGSFGGGYYVGTWPKDFKPVGTRSYKNAEADAEVLSSIVRTASAPKSDSQSTNVIANGTMTAGSDKVENWTQTWTGKGKIVVQRDTTNFRGAPASLSLSSEGGEASGLVSQIVDVKPGERLTLIGDLRSAGEVKVNLAVQSFNENWNSINFTQAGFVAGTSNWSRVEKNIVVPKDAAHVTVALLLEGNGTAWLDDVSLVREAKPIATKGESDSNAGTPATKTAADKIPPFRNGNFEDGTSGPFNWQSQGSAKVTRDTTAFREGVASLRIDVTEGEGKALQTLALKGGDQLKASGSLKTAGSIKSNAFIMSFDSAGTFLRFDQLKYAQNDSDWQDFERAVTLPSGTQSVAIGVLGEGKGIAWLDRFSLTVNGIVADAPGIAPAPVAKTETAPEKGKPNTPAWGFFKPYPKAWMAVFNEQLERTKRGNVDVAFIGDSLTQSWGGSGIADWNGMMKPLNAVNYGIGGDSTRQVLYRLENGLLDGLKPKLVVLMIGTNNLYSDFNAGSDDDIAEGIKACVDKVKEKVPNAKILLLGLLPRQNNFFITRINKINSKLEHLDDGKVTFYLHVGNEFKKDDNGIKPELFDKDQLHLSKAGYRVLGEQILPTIQKLMQ